MSHFLVRKHRHLIPSCMPYHAAASAAGYKFMSHFLVRKHHHLIPACVPYHAAASAAGYHFAEPSQKNGGNLILRDMTCLYCDHIIWTWIY